MKRIIRTPERFEVMDLFRAVARKHGLRLDDQTAIPRFMELIEEGLSSGRNNPVVIHGHRIEGMFEHVVAGLGRTLAIKKEDSGELCFAGEDIQPPDFRLVLDSQQEILVEVKNCHQVDPGYRYTLSAAYVAALQRYAGLFQRDIYVAIFWSSWKYWTLNAVEDFDPAGGFSISFLKAAQRNQMAMLGDVMVGTTPALTLRLYADPDKPRLVGEDGQCVFTIGRVEILCAGIPIEDQSEQNLAFYFMLNSNWPTEDGKPCIESGLLEYLEYVAAPEESIPDQGFDMLGSLSSMISRSYNDRTASAGIIQSLSPAAEPGSLAIVIPKDYRGKHLPLWRFHVEPTPAEPGGG